MTLLCIPLHLRISYSCHHDLPPKLLDLLHHSCPSVTCHVAWLISAPNGAAASHGCPLGQEGSSAAAQSHGDQDARRCPALLPPTPTAEQTDKIMALETIAPGRHKPPNICKRLHLLVLWDFYNVCFHLHYSSSCCLMPCGDVFLRRTC